NMSGRNSLGAAPHQPETVEELCPISLAGLQ
ncbi:MAG: hypothetical protein ACI841_004122, partial [Planctomycetota bacterium]